tara:strand:- start:3538 stop:5712 length:2175 start_codon:yes stop_codon:yes gene_type:complete
VAVDMGQSRGSMKLLAKTEEYFDSPNWDNMNGFETPFGAMAEILNSWPGPTQTSEQTTDERYFRLICTIAGYPEILAGRRPLDIPLHKKSELALKLSEFLDRIKPDSNSEWHSLRTYILHYDLTKNKLEAKVKICNVVDYLVCAIRHNSTYSNYSDYPLEYHSEEIHFLNALHSSDTDRVNQFWPKDPQAQRKLKLDLIYINSDEEKRNYIEHEFKFDEIHSWISRWATPKNIAIFNENFAQKWIIAASGILESLFAMMRSYVLKEKRPGSIVVDGGGRISYISESSRDEEKTWFADKLYNSFIFDRENPHPFADVIREVIEEYALNNKSNPISKIIQEKYEGMEEHLWWEDGKPKTELYQLLIGQKSTTFFFPRVVCDKNKTRNNPERFLINPFANKKPWHSEECIFCNDSIETNFELNLSSCRSVINEGYTICPFHFMFESIARSIGIRHTSYSELFKKQPTFFDSTGKRKILTDIISFDGNSVGDYFGLNYDDYRQPKIQECLDLWNEQKESILKIDEKFIFAGHGTKQEQYVQRKEIFQPRLQVLIRKQRRSFDFNSKWWVALRNSMMENIDCSLVPWILAGDDIVLVNKSASTSESILKFLNTFHHNLADVFKGKITFAGSIQLRKTSDSILSSFSQGSALEKNSALVWKRLAESDFPDLFLDRAKKIEKLNKQWTSGKHPEAPFILEWIQSDEATKFVFNSKYDPVSIMVPSNWNEEE